MKIDNEVHHRFMRNNTIRSNLIAWILFVGITYPNTLFAQQIRVEDYKHFYNPDVEGFLLNFKPTNAHLLSIAQAQQLRDSIFFNNWGEVRKSRIQPDTRSKFYEIDGMLMSAYIWSDSLYWQAEQDALVQEKPIKKYKNEMGIANYIRFGELHPSLVKRSYYRAKTLLCIPHSH